MKGFQTPDNKQLKAAKKRGLGRAAENRLHDLDLSSAEALFVRCFFKKYIFYSVTYEFSIAITSGR